MTRARDLARWVVAATAWAAAGGASAAGGGSSGAEFLRVGLGTRPAAMGESFTGLADDVTAAVWNPAGLGQLETAQLTGMHLAYLADTSYEFVAGSMPVESLGGSFALSLAYVNVPPFDSTGGVAAAKATAADGVAAVSFGGSMKALATGEPELDNLYYGVSGKVIYRSLGGYAPAGGSPQTYSAIGGAADVGFLYRIAPDLTAGVSVLNVGTPITFLGDAADALPMTVRGGFGWRAYDTEAVRATVLADVAKPVDPDGGTFLAPTWGGVGAEVVVSDLIALRAGFRQGPDGARPVGGAGFALGGVSVDYAFVPLGDFGNAHRFGLTWKPGGGRAKPLPPVAELRADPLPQGRVAVRWAAQPKAVGYVVDLKRPGAGYKRLTPKPRTAPELSMRGLKPGGEYEFRVLAVDGHGREGEPADLAFTPPAPVPAVAAKLPAPRSFAVTPVVGPGRRAHVQWIPVEGASGYKVYWRKAGGHWKPLFKVPTQRTSFGLRGLPAGRNQFTVAAVSPEGKLGTGCRPLSVAIAR